MTVFCLEALTSEIYIESTLFVMAYSFSLVNAQYCLRGVCHAKPDVKVL